MTAHHCPTCSCEAPDPSTLPWKDQPLVELPDGRLFCPAHAMAGKQSLTCLLHGHHAGPHEDRIIDPCPFCGAWDEHTDWCQLCDWENVVWAIQSLLGNRQPPRIEYPHVLHFAQDGPGEVLTYWIAASSDAA